MFKLRTYQEKGKNDMLNFLNRSWGTKKGIVVAPCGAGKSLYIAATANELNTPLLVIQPSKELLEQNYKKYVSYGNEASIYSASLKSKEVGKVTFATPMSLQGKAALFKDVRVVLIDEAHVNCKQGSITDLFLKRLHKDVKVIGLTATPVLLRNGMYGAELRMLNRTRDSIFNEIIHVTQIQDIVAQNFWTPIKYEIYKQKEDSLVINTNGSAYTDDSLETFFFENKLDEQVVDLVEKLKATKKSILVFVPTISAAEAISQKIPKSAYVHSKMTSSARENIVTGFQSGSIQTVINVNVLSTGFDFADLRCVIDCTPTMSLARYYQKLGRGVRIAPNKAEVLLVDLGNNYDRFGKLEDITFEDYPGIGWAMFSGDRLVSERPINSARVTKAHLDAQHANTIKNDTTKVLRMTFGKFKDYEITKLPMWYIEWLLANLSFNSAQGLALKKALLEVQESEKTKNGSTKSN